MASGYPADMNLSAYFDRIGYSGPTAPDFATLDALMRAHAATVPFENLDVQLGRAVSFEPEAIFDKLVATLTTMATSGGAAAGASSRTGCSAGRWPSWDSM